MSGRGGLGSIVWLMLLAPLLARAEQAGGCFEDDPAVIQQPQTPVREDAPTGPANTLEAARRLNDSGNTAFERGDLATAQIDHRKALAVRQALAPRSLLVAESLNALGNVALERGELDRKSTRLNSSHVLRSRMPSSA